MSRDRLLMVSVLDSAMRVTVSDGQAAVLWRLYRQPRGRRGDASYQFVGASSLLFMAARCLEKRATSNGILSEVAPLLANGL